MNRIRAVLLLGAFALCPTPAFAQLDALWEWAEHWSGPGPWDEKGFNVRVWCWTTEPRDENTPRGVATRQQTHKGCWATERTTESNRKISGYIDMRVSLAQTGGAYYNKDNPRFEDENDTRTIKAFTGAPAFMARVTPLIDIGAGIGWSQFSGDGFDTFGRLITMPLIVSIAPFAALRPENPKMRFLKIRFEEFFYPSGFDGQEEFGGQTTKYKTRSEWVRSAGIAIDLTTLFGLRK